MKDINNYIRSEEVSPGYFSKIRHLIASSVFAILISSGTAYSKDSKNCTLDSYAAGLTSANCMNTGATEDPSNPQIRTLESYLEWGNNGNIEDQGDQEREDGTHNISVDTPQNEIETPWDFKDNQWLTLGLLGGGLLGGWVLFSRGRRKYLIHKKPLIQEEFNELHSQYKNLCSPERIREIFSDASLEIPSSFIQYENSHLWMRNNFTQYQSEREAQSEDQEASVIDYIKFLLKSISRIKRLNTRHDITQSTNDILGVVAEYLEQIPQSETNLSESIATAINEEAQSISNTISSQDESSQGMLERFGRYSEIIQEIQDSYKTYLRVKEQVDDTIASSDLGGALNIPSLTGYHSYLPTILENIKRVTQELRALKRKIDLHNNELQGLRVLISKINQLIQELKLEDTPLGNNIKTYTILPHLDTDFFESGRGKRRLKGLGVIVLELRKAQQISQNNIGIRSRILSKSQDLVAQTGNKKIRLKGCLAEGYHTPDEAKALLYVQRYFTQEEEYSWGPNPHSEDSDIYRFEMDLYTTRISQAQEVEQALDETLKTREEYPHFFKSCSRHLATATKIIQEVPEESAPMNWESFVHHSAEMLQKWDILLQTEFKKNKAGTFKTLFEQMNVTVFGSRVDTHDSLYLLEYRQNMLNCMITSYTQAQEIKTLSKKYKGEELEFYNAVTSKARKINSMDCDISYEQMGSGIIFFIPKDDYESSIDKNSGGMHFTSSQNKVLNGCISIISSSQRGRAFEQSAKIHEHHHGLTGYSLWKRGSSQIPEPLYSAADEIISYLGDNCGQNAYQILSHNTEGLYNYFPSSRKYHGRYKGIPLKSDRRDQYNRDIHKLYETAKKVKEVYPETWSFLLRLENPDNWDTIDLSGSYKKAA